MLIKHSIECWIFDPRRRAFLLLKCPETERHVPYWQPVTGGIEEGEDIYGACLREIAEETSLELVQQDLHIILKDYVVKVPQENRELHKNIFVVRKEVEQVQISDEHIDFCWVEPAGVKERLLWESNKATFDYSCQYLNL